MNTLTMEQFQVMLNDDVEKQENPLFEVLDAIRQLSFSVDDIFDGIEGSGWLMWW